MSRRTALLWMTHVWTPEIEAEFEKLRGIQGENAPDVWLLLDSRAGNAAQLAARYGRTYTFNQGELYRLPYPRMAGNRLVDHCHFSTLSFFLSHPDYEYYWVLEYDVRYTGDWKQFLDSFDRRDHDLITCHIRRFRDEPRWWWWPSLEHPTAVIPRQQYARSFNVIHRLSHRALEYIHRAQLDGWRGLAEVTFPTLLLHGGFSLLDFGGNGEFAPADRRNAAYTSRTTKNGSFYPYMTVRFHPARLRAGNQKNKLYHPVKPAFLRDRRWSRMKSYLQWFSQVILDLFRK